MLQSYSEILNRAHYKRNLGFVTKKRKQKRMFDREIQPKHIYPAIIVFAVLIFGANIWGSSIYILDEAKNSGCAREMFEKGEWVVPTFNYELRTDKPPLHYFFMKAGYAAFGVNPFGARVFSVVFGVLTLLITFFYTRKFLGYNTAVWSVMALLSSLHFALEFHLAVPDPYLIFFMALAFMAFYDFYKSRSRTSWWLLYLSVALGTLAKGPIAIALPGLVFLVFLMLRKGQQWKLVKAFKPVLGALVVLLVALPWYYLVGQETNGEWLRGFFLEHNINRFADAKEGHGGFFLVIPAFILFGMLPFSVFMVQGLVRNRKVVRNDDFATYSFIVSVVIIGFFMISGTKLPNYAMPAYPFLAITTMYYILKQANHSAKYPFIIHLVVAALIPVLAYIALKIEPSLGHITYLAWGFITLPVGALIALILQLKKRFFPALRVLAGTWMVTALIFFFGIFPEIDRQNPVSMAFRQIDLKEKKVAYYGKFNPAFSFYLQRKIPELQSGEEVQEFLSEDNAVVITIQRKLDELESVDNKVIKLKQKDLFERPTTVLLIPEK